VQFPVVPASAISRRAICINNGAPESAVFCAVQPTRCRAWGCLKLASRCPGAIGKSGVMVGGFASRICARKAISAIAYQPPRPVPVSAKKKQDLRSRNAARAGEFRALQAFAIECGECHLRPRPVAWQPRGAQGLCTSPLDYRRTLALSTAQRVDTVPRLPPEARVSRVCVDPQKPGFIGREPITGSAPPVQRLQLLPSTLRCRARSATASGPVRYGFRLRFLRWLSKQTELEPGVHLARAGQRRATP